MKTPTVVTVPAIRFHQSGKTLYQFAARIQELADHLKIDKWDPDLDANDPQFAVKQGYQREPSRSHYSSVARYFSEDEHPLMPNTILVVARRPIKFEPVGEELGGRQMGKLTIDKDTVLWIVDGQHRKLGAEYALQRYKDPKGVNMQMPFTLLTNGDDDSDIKRVEVKEFYLINSKAKRIRTDLAEQLMLQMSEDEGFKSGLVRKGDVWKLRKTAITNAINEREGSPWYGRIKLPNSSSKAVASSASFGTSLRPLLTGGFTKELDDEELLTLIDRYWSALEELMPEAFENPDDYVLLKTPGMFAMHMVAPRVFEICRGDNGNFSKEKIKSIFLASPESEEYFQSAFWRSRSHEEGAGDAASYNSMGGFRELADKIGKELPEVRVKISL